MNNVENVFFNERDFTEVCKKGFINNDPVSKLQMIDFIKNGFTIRHINNNA